MPVCLNSTERLLCSAWSLHLERFWNLLAYHSLFDLLRSSQPHNPQVQLSQSALTFFPAFSALFARLQFASPCLVPGITKLSESCSFVSWTRTSKRTGPKSQQAWVQASPASRFGTSCGSLLPDHIISSPGVINFQLTFIYFCTSSPDLTTTFPHRLQPPRPLHTEKFISFSTLLPSITRCLSPGR